MDFTGLGKHTAYKIDRPLTEEELQCRLKPDRSENVTALDWLSVIKINSTYLELTDRWYPVKGVATWLGLMVVLPLLGMIFGLLWVAIERNETGAWVLLGVVVLVSSLLIWGGIYAIRLDAFRQTHYPIRLNRKTRQIYAFRPDGSILTAPWDALYLCAVTTQLPLFASSVDIRAHVLGEDGETIRDTFTLGYPYLGDKKGLLQLWEYVRRYMEEPGGVEKNYRLTDLCLPIHGRREGLVFGIVRTFAPAANHLLVQLLFSPIASLIIVGRWLAMCTNKVPRWPQDVEAACQINPDDPYCKDWRSNGKYDFYELGWPLICFIVGLVVLGVGIILLARAI